MTDQNVFRADSSSLVVSGMSCGGCAKSVERAQLRVPGVDTVQVNLSTGHVVVEGTALMQALIGAVQAAGYSAQPV